jgi:hypothetical protein
MKYIIIILSLVNVKAESVIDLGNLEIEGEVRRPMMNLFHNPSEVSKSYDTYVNKRIIKFGRQYSTLKVLTNGNESKKLTEFEQSVLELR